MISCGIGVAAMDGADIVVVCRDRRSVCRFLLCHSQVVDFKYHGFQYNEFSRTVAVDVPAVS